MDSLTREQILLALRTLGTELGDAGERVELFALGGAALVLLYGARDSTRDVDVVAEGDGLTPALRAASARVAAAQGLPSDWLNDAAKGYVHGLAPGSLLLESGRLRVRALEPRQLLAMKLSAWRDDVDIADARLLLQQLSGAREAVWAMVDPFVVPGRELKARYAFDDLWEGDRGPA